MFWILWNEASDRPPKVKFTDLNEARKGALAMARKHGGTFHVMASCDDARGEEKVVRTMEVTTTWKDSQNHEKVADYAKSAERLREQLGDSYGFVDAPSAMPTIQVDYMQVGHAQTFRVPMFAYREGELQPGTKVLLLGDGVDDQIGVIDCWSTDHQVQISLVTAA